MQARRFTGGVVVWVLAVLLAATFATAILLWLWPRPVAGWGGIPVPGRLVLSVPHFRQADPCWGGDLLADTPGTLAGEGCAVASAAMVLSQTGVDTDPGRLNAFLTTRGGYEGRGWLRWESAALFPGAGLEKAYEGPPSHGLIDWNLLRGNPVIARIRRPDGITHFVVIVGKEGVDYLIRDPAGPPGESEVSTLGGLGVPVEALRFYRRAAGAGK